MASISLYTQSATEGSQTYTLAEANLLDATKNTHYTEDFLYKTTNPTTQEDVWVVNLSIPLAGMDYVSPSKGYQPLPHYQLINHDGYFYPDYVDPAAEALTEEPTDWELHWRDYYTENKFVYWDDNLKRYYYGAPLYPNSSGVAPTWRTGIYYKTNQVRHIYWTLDGNYFPLTWGWLDINNTVYYGLQFAWAQYGKYNVNWDSHWENVNNPRFAGVSGPLVYGNTGNGENYFSFVHNYGADTSLSSDIDPHVYFNFIGFKYKFMDTSGTEPVEKTEEFVGLIAWEESIDGIPQRAKIVGLSKNFFGARKKPANGGPISGIQGGNGTFSAPSNNRGDRNGDTARAIAGKWNEGSSLLMQGQHFYVANIEDTESISSFAEFRENVTNPQGWSNFTNLMYSPLDAILNCYQCPALFAPTGGTRENVRAAHKAWTETAQMATFSTIYDAYNIGSIDISNYTDSFADFTNTSIYINLPYVGTKTIDVPSCMSALGSVGWLAVDYLIDRYSADCTAIVTVSDLFGNTELRYEWKGNFGKKVNFTQIIDPYYRGLLSAAPAVAGLAVGAVGGAVTGLVAASVANKALSTPVGSGLGTASQRLASGATAARASSAAQMSPINTMSSATSLATSMATSATSAALAGNAITSNNASGGVVSSPINTECWCVIIRPEWSNPELYNIERAYPSDISGQVGDFQGFLAVSEAELSNIDCTDIERTEIMQRLTSGVYTS